MYLKWLLLLACAAVAVAWLARGALGRWSSRRQFERATAALTANAHLLEEQFLESAAATGKPRGLVWKQSSFHDAALLVRDRATGDLYALVGITIAFEAALGGGMEEVEAVNNLRCATALLEWRGKQWTTAGRVMFNLEPSEAVERYPKNLDLVDRVLLGQ